MQHDVHNNVAICCVEMLGAFGRGLSFEHTQQRIDTIHAEPFLVKFNLSAKKGLCPLGDMSCAVLKCFFIRVHYYLSFSS